jgi:outer membrane protein TolC
MSHEPDSIQPRHDDTAPVAPEIRQSPRQAAANLTDPTTKAASASRRQDLTRVHFQATTSAQPGVPPSALPDPEQEYPIDLDTALRLAAVENPLIAQARQRIGESLALQQQARALLLPSLNIGTSYHGHTGNLERSSGAILNLNQQSFYVGGGAAPITAGTIEYPAVRIYSQLTDAIFEPLAAHQQVESSRFSATAAANNILLEVSQLHFELLAAAAILNAHRESAVQEAEVVRLTRAYANAQQGREADAERAATELSLLQIEIQHAEEEVAVASARLARRLHLDQSVRLQPVADNIEILTIVDPDAPLSALLATAVRRRPEIGARASALAASQIRVQQEQCRPLLPTVLVGFSGGALGGGSNLTGPELAHFGGRTDFDVLASWTLLNLGVGNLSLVKQRRAQAGEAAGEQARTIAEIRTEVAAALADVTAAQQQIDITTRELASAELGFREDLLRIRNTVGRPLEAVNSLQLLNRARAGRIRAITDYNKAQFRLFVALGSPPPLRGPASAPIAPAPVASPPLPPLAGRT